MSDERRTLWLCECGFTGRYDGPLSDVPEGLRTDECSFEDGYGQRCGKERTASEWVPASLADRLERERDEARAALEAERETAERWREEAWQCYLASGADPDGADARHLNPGEALYAVQELRRDYDECPAPEDLQAAEARAEAAERQLGEAREGLIEENYLCITAEARFAELAAAVDRHREELDRATLGGSRRERDDVDNDLYNVLYRMRAALQGEEER